MSRFHLLIVSIILLSVNCINLNVVYRDFKLNHPDFELGICDPQDVFVTSTLNDKYPEYQDDTACVTSPTTFNQWFRDITDLNRRINMTINVVLTGSVYSFVPPSDGFFPIDNMGYGNEPISGRNNYFTMHVTASFVYQGGEHFTLSSDDDSWVYVNKKLVLYNSAYNGIGNQSFSWSGGKNPLNLVSGQKYNVDIFYADRVAPSSYFSFSTNMQLQVIPVDSSDADGDGVAGEYDNCFAIPNPNQIDCNENGYGDACDSEGGQIAFPFYANVTLNYDPKQKSWSKAINLMNLKPTQTLNFIDPLPSQTIHSQYFKISVAIKNNVNINCLIGVVLSSSLSKSGQNIIEVKSGTGVYTTFFNNIFDVDGLPFYNYKYPPYNSPPGGSQTDGSNNIAFTSLTPNCSLDLGGVIIKTTYSPLSNNVPNIYYNRCIGTSACEYGTSFFQGFCACWSGAYGRQCTMGENTKANQNVSTPWSSLTFGIDEYTNRGMDQPIMNNLNFQHSWNNHKCNIWADVDPLSTSAVPVVQSHSFEDGNLYIVISLPITDLRAETVLFFNSDKMNPNTRRDCVYPTSSYISKVIDGCNDLFVIDMPWAIANKCGWYVENQPTDVTYHGYITLQTSEWLDVISEWREIQSVLQVKLAFQRYTVFGIPAIGTFNNADLIVSVINQTVDFTKGFVAIIDFSTTLPSPYKLKEGYLGNYPFNIQQYDLYYVDCSDGSSPCVQFWRVYLTLIEGSCDFDGDYSFNWTLSCYNNCSIDDSSLIVGTTLSLSSLGFCANVAEDSYLLGALTPFTDNTYTTKSTSINSGDTVFLNLNISSGLNKGKNNKTIQYYSTQINYIDVTSMDSNLKIRIWSTSSAVFWNPNDDPKPNVNIISNSNNNTKLSFVFTNGIANLLKTKDPNFFINIELQATYVDLTGMQKIDKKCYNTSISVSGLVTNYTNPVTGYVKMQREVYFIISETPSPVTPPPVNVTSTSMTASKSNDGNLLPLGILMGLLSFLV